MGKGAIGSDRSGPQILVALLAPAKGRCNAGAEAAVPPKRAPGKDPPPQREKLGMTPRKQLKLQKERIAARDRQAVKPVNTPPPKGGGFRLRLEAGLIDPSGR